MLQIFLKGGPVMWPLLVTSLIALTVVFERLVFVFLERSRRQPEIVEAILAKLAGGDLAGAIAAGDRSQDFVARTLVYGLQHQDKSLSHALLHAAARELKQFNRCLTTLDTIITLAPLLGLLGTVTGMIHSFGLLGTSELGSPTEITGGIAEALIATAFGLAIAITALIPFNFLNARLEEARLQIQEAATQLKLLLAKSPPR